MEDESGYDAKILAVPTAKLTAEYAEVEEMDHLPKSLRQRIEHFFEHYKDLEPGKWVRLSGWGDADEARQVIQESIERHKGAQ
jgi:inorganic pyrophosphatase